ncbi:Arm DNA-binding domain-containing protein [Pedobacter ginsenosidimutans]|uniref:Arm DNA-binding domain-containing protein n=1 Tax=Pedobacter ginsenosidimutans TaxID=687842 RepID=UPI0009FB58FF|nr:Arm DNA-binding domain-containing protein [Pedobacter ginsenosidimutans]
MKSQHTFALSFYLKRENELNGKAPIYAKITVDGKYLRLAVKRSVESEFWNQRTQRLMGNTPEIILLREKLKLCISVKVTPLFRAKLATNLITG